MHKSVDKYSKAVGCTPGQIRRYIRSGLIPSAELVKPRMGRPFWVIEDVSGEAIGTLKAKLASPCLTRPTFFEPALRQICEKTPNGTLGVTRNKIYWRPIHKSLDGDNGSTFIEIVERIALLFHGLTPNDLFQDRRRPVDAAHEKKMNAYERTKYRLLFGLHKSPSSFTHRWVWRTLNKSLRRTDIIHGAQQLALYHRIYGIETNYKTLGQVLGMSKSTLYRNYGELVGEALQIARANALGPTQRDSHSAERLRHPGLLSETHDQRSGLFRPHFGRDDDSEDEGPDGRGGDLHGYSLMDSSPADLPFETLFNAAVELLRAGEPLSGESLELLLRRKKILNRSDRLSCYYSETDIKNAINAARDYVAGASVSLQLKKSKGCWFP